MTGKAATMHAESESEEEGKKAQYVGGGAIEAAPRHASCRCCHSRARARS